MKKIEEMNKKEYDVYIKLLNCKQTGNRATYADIQMIWNTFISNAALCNSCTHMLSNAFSKIIRFFEGNKDKIPNFDSYVEPEVVKEPEVSPIEESLINKIEQYGISMRYEPHTSEEPEVFGTIDNDRACLWCGIIFTPQNGNHKYCTSTCREKMQEYRVDQRKIKVKENKLINGKREE